MPITGKLSRAVYERLGDVVANELADWFNAIDAAYRDDLRKAYDLKFEILEAKLEHQRAALTVVMERLEAKIDRLSASARICG